MIVIGIYGAWSELASGTMSAMYHGYSTLVAYATGHVLYSLSYVFRGATYIDKWAVTHTLSGVRGTILSWLHVLTEDPHVNVFVGSVMIVASLPDIWRTFTDDVPGLISPASTALLLYGVFNVLKTLVPILMGVVYIHRGRLVRKQTEDPAPS
jgi:hypothetical protein